MIVAGNSQSCLIEIIVSQDLLGVLTHGHITVPHAERISLCLQVLGQAVRLSQSPLLLPSGTQSTTLFSSESATAFRHPQSPGPRCSPQRKPSAVQLVHLLLTGGEEQVAVHLLDHGCLRFRRRSKLKLEVTPGFSLRGRSRQWRSGSRSGRRQQNDRLHALTGGSLQRRRRGGCGGRYEVLLEGAAAGRQGWQMRMRCRQRTGSRGGGS